VLAVYIQVIGVSFCLHHGIVKAYILIVVLVGSIRFKWCSFDSLYALSLSHPPEHLSCSWGLVSHKITYIDFAMLYLYFGSCDEEHGDFAGTIDIVNLRNNFCYLCLTLTALQSMQALQRRVLVTVPQSEQSLSNIDLSLGWIVWEARPLSSQKSTFCTVDTIT
jgi:hypothetical protein